MLKRFFQFAAAVSLMSAFFALSACSIPKMDGSDPTGKRAIIDSTNMALSYGDCSSALATILPLYNSINADNEVRTVTASAYGCWAGVNLFKNLGQIVTNLATLSNGLWTLLAQLYPSKANDTVVESAEFATDALQAVLIPGHVIALSNYVNYGSFNPGSDLIGDRGVDSSLYLVFISMAGIGGIENRFGNPNPVTFVSQNNPPLPWNTAAAVNSDGCAYASSVINFVDAVGVAAQNLTGNLQIAFNTIASTYGAAVLQACDVGCQGSNPGYGVVSGCVGNATRCVGCPSLLRDRRQCKGAVTDQISCAAAGIVNFVNAGPGKW